MQGAENNENQIQIDLRVFLMPLHFVNNHENICLNYHILLHRHSLVSL